MALEARGEFLRVFALAAVCAAHMERIADKQTNDVPLLRYIFQAIQVVADARARKRIDALGGDSQCIADGQADAFFADIERENATGRRLFGEALQIGL